MPCGMTERENFNRPYLEESTCEMSREEGTLERYCARNYRGCDTDVQVQSVMDSEAD